MNTGKRRQIREFLLRGRASWAICSVIKRLIRRADQMRHFIYVCDLILLALTISCSGKPGNKAVTSVQPATAANEAPAIKLVRIVSPEENKGFKLNSPVKIDLALEDINRKPDSVQVYFDGNRVRTIKSDPWEYLIPSSFNATTGKKSLKVTAFSGGRSRNTVTRFIIIYSDIIPRKYGYRIIRSYPHDRHAFTQGLIYDNGVLYESTGQENESTLREVELETGKVKRQQSLDPSLFGEGITLYGEHIYLVTWTSKVGFVFDKKSFNLLNKIYYPTQGWGLTTIKDRIVLSDGTEVLYFYEPSMFTVASRIEVYDNEKKVDSLNELEFINGEIWANIWMTDLIARIDPVSGKVNGYVDLKGILPESERDSETDVLNGIAFDTEGKRLFVTGKRWPKLYEIRLTE
jgi:glutaminyl-peptide cyclotransferase